MTPNITPDALDLESGNAVRNGKPPGKDLKVRDIQAARKNRETYRHAALTLDAFDRLAHEDRRTQRELKAEVERDARRQL